MLKTLVRIPAPLPDQTLESYTALTALENGLSWKQAVQLLFGWHGLQIGALFPPALGVISSALDNAGYDSPTEFIEQHTYLRIFKPFMSRHQYQAVLEKSLGRKVTGIHNLLGVDAPSRFIKSELHYCRQCAENDVTKYGFAYAHRAHQIRGVDFCAIHGVHLTTCVNRGKKLGLHGVLLHPSEQLCSHGSSAKIPRVKSQDGWDGWIDFLLNGDPLKLNPDLFFFLINKAPFLERFNNPLESEIVSPLNRLLVTHTSLSLMEAAKINYKTTSFSFANHFVKPQPQLNDALTRLLLMASLYTSPTTLLKTATAIIQNPLQYLGIRSKVTPSLVILPTLSNIKLFFKYRRLDELSQALKVSTDEILEFLSEFTELERRRKQYFLKQKILAARKKLLKQLNEMPTLLKDDFSKKHHTQYRWLMRHDHDWFQTIMPGKVEVSNNRLKSYYLEKDSQVADIITRIATESYKQHPPVRVSVSFIKRSIPKDAFNLFQNHSLSEAELRLLEVTETPRQFRVRIEQQLIIYILTDNMALFDIFFSHCLKDYKNQKSFHARLKDLQNLRHEIAREILASRSPNLIEQTKNVCGLKVHRKSL